MQESSSRAPTGSSAVILSRRSPPQARAFATFCMYNSISSLGWLDEMDPYLRAAVEPRLGDIRDARFVDTACAGIDVVFHLAALIAIPYRYHAPEAFIDTNVRGTLSVLEAARRRKCRRVVQTSTSEVYGTPATRGLTPAILAQLLSGSRET